jgi:xanthine dehydrogenase molybdopterin-binding subunit B
LLGKHDFITYAVGLNADGSVKQIEVMVYRRETYGYEIRNDVWARAIRQAKNANSTFKLDHDIKNISGATLSCRQ